MTSGIPMIVAVPLLEPMMSKMSPPHENIFPGLLGSPNGPPLTIALHPVRKSNHRNSTSDSIMRDMQRVGWTYEGTVMCSRP